MTVFNKLLSTLIFSLLTFLALSPLAAALADKGTAAPVVLLLVLAVVWLIVFSAPTIRRAWGRGALVAGAAFLALPLSTAVLSGRAAQEVTARAEAGTEAATAVGATIGAGLMVGASVLVGLVLGAILLILGLVLVLGGRREVIVLREGGGQAGGA